MVLILLPLLWNHNNLILQLHQKKTATLMKGGFLTDRIKVGSVPGMMNKEVLAQFIYKPA